MNFTKTDGDRLVIASAFRTPIGQLSKSYLNLESSDLAFSVIKHIFSQKNINKNDIDLVVSGEIMQSSKTPNIARVLSVKADLPTEATAITVSNNCASGYEAINEASRRILLDENSIALVTGQESMSKFPLYIENARSNKKTSSPAKITLNWDTIKDSITIKDSMDEGLTDPIRNANMAETGEVIAQKLDLTKEMLDNYAHNSYSKTLKATENGTYLPYIVPISHDDKVFNKDEFIMSKISMVEKPERFAKATAIFDFPPHTDLKSFYTKYGKWIGKEYQEGVTKAAVTLFNACPRSDGAGALILTTESKAKELGLEIQAYIKSWANASVDPMYMGIGMSYAMDKALKQANVSWNDVSSFEIHEAFAATALGSMHVVRDELGYDLLKRYEDGDINRNGGTLALGHPLGATGLRIAINQIIALKEENGAKYSLGTICAGGGVAAALLLEKP